jgi:hypothetical protein
LLFEKYSNMAADDTRFAIDVLFYILSNFMEKVPQKKKCSSGHEIPCHL